MHLLHLLLHLTIAIDGVPKPPQVVIHAVPWIAFGFTTFLCICGIVFAVVCIVLMLVLWNRRYRIAKICEL